MSELSQQEIDQLRRDMKDAMNADKMAEEMVRKKELKIWASVIEYIESTGKFVVVYEGKMESKYDPESESYKFITPISVEFLTAEELEERGWKAQHQIVCESHKP